MRLLRVLGLILPTLLVAGILPAQTRRSATSTKSIAEKKCGPLSGQWLNCPKFGFTYKVIFGWVDRTADMQQNEVLPGQPDSESPKATNAADQPQPASSDSSETLLAVFERPPAAPGETINSAVVIAAEPVANYHGLKTAADYFSAITGLAEQRGFKVVNEPHVFALGAKRLVRGDYSKERGKLIMWQTSLVMIEKGNIVSFTFIGGGEDEVNDLINGLVFSGTKPNSQIPKEKK